MLQGRQGDRGQDLVEYAIVFPVLMLLLLGIIEFGRIIYSYNAISNAAREGTRLAVLPGTANRNNLAAAIALSPAACDPSPANPILQRVCDRAMALSRADLQVTVSQPDLDLNGEPDPIVRIRVVYTGPFLTNVILQAVRRGGLRLEAAATMRLE